jgi:hypothetical protein
MAFTTLDPVPEGDRAEYRKFLDASLERREAAPRDLGLKLLDGFLATTRR